MTNTTNTPYPTFLMRVQIKVSSGPEGDPRRQELRGPQRVPGQPLSQRRPVHQPRHGGAVHLPLSLRILWGQLRAHAGRAHTQTLNGSTCHHAPLSIVHLG